MRVTTTTRKKEVQTAEFANNYVLKIKKIVAEELAHWGRVKKYIVIRATARVNRSKTVTYLRSTALRAKGFQNNGRLTIE